MRKANVFILAVSVAISMLLFSCKEDMGPGGDDSPISDRPISSINLPDDIVGNINDASVESPFVEEYEDTYFESLMMGDRRDKNDRRKDLRKDRRKKEDRRKRHGDRDLTDEQKELIEQARLEYVECASDYRQIISEIHRTLFADANEVRKAIMEQLRAGDITKEEARELMHAIRERVKGALESNTEFQRALAALKDCQATLRATMQRILNM